MNKQGDLSVITKAKEVCSYILTITDKSPFDEITQSVRSYNGHLKHGHTWKLRKHIYSNTIFTKSKEDSDETIKA